MATDREIWKGVLGSQLESNGDIVGTAGDGITLAKELWRRTVVGYTGGDNATAATAAAEACVWYAPRACRVIAAKLLPCINVGTNNTDYVTFTVAKRTAGGAATTLATVNTHGGAQGSLVEWCSTAMSLTATTSALDLAAGDVVTVKVAKAGSGKAVGVVLPSLVTPAVVLDVEEI